MLPRLLTASPAPRPARIRALLAGILVVGCAGGGGGAGSSGGWGCPSTRGQQVVNLLNQARTAEGLDPVRVDLRLAQAAGDHARYMAETGYQGHQGENGSLPADRASAAGYPWTLVAENTSAGYGTAAATFAGWTASPSHRANNLAPDVRHVGVGYAENADSEYRSYWVLLFGATEAPPREPQGGCHP